MEYKKKLTDIFLRKDEKSKKQIVPEKPKVVQFDESYFEAQLDSENIQTSLMKINAVVKKGINAGQQIPLKCRWYIKNQFDFKEIQEVKTNFFQPCLEDVGNIICVQIEPQIQGMTYTGITIMKQSDQLKMDKRVQNMTNQYFISKHLQMEGKIEAMYSQNPKFENYEFPLDVVIQLRQNKVSFKEKVSKQLITQYEINEEFPLIDFNRKSFNSILLTCSQSQSMKLSLANNFNRDLFALIVRSIPNRFSITSTQDQLPILELNSPVRAKSFVQNPSEQTTKLILKLDELNKQIKNLRRINEDLTTNYHLERNAKINLQNEIQKLKSILQITIEQHKQCKPLHAKIKQVSQQNKFYFGEISLMKTQLKEKTNTIKELKYEITNLKSQNKAFQNKLEQLAQVPKIKIQALTEELMKTKSLQEKLQVENQTLVEKIHELENQNNLLKKKVSSIANQKSLPSTPVLKSPAMNSSFQHMTPSKDLQTEINSLRMQIKNLQMLLKYKSGQKGGDLISMHHLINSLTEKITEKQIEIQSLKKINKQITKNKNISAFSLHETQ